jgi:predicted Holliday junction resolvase-like endonuclease
MNLVSSSTDLSFVYLKSLLRAINQHVESKEYAVVLKRTKKSKNEIINKTWIICDRERKIHEVIELNRRHCDSKHIQCSFFIIAKLDENIQCWLYEIKDSKHNHEAIITESYLVHRKMTMIFEIKSDISRQLTMRTALFKILFTLRLDLVFDDSSLFKSRDIYNLKAKLRREDFESLTFIQALMRELNNQNDDWISSFQKNARDQITHLFLSKRVVNSFWKSITKFSY